MESPSGSSKVLVVCDSPVVREVLQLMLLECSEDILIEEDRARGSELIAGRPGFDLGILDANLRDGDAFELLAEVVKSPEPRPRVIMITCSEIESKHAMASGADECLTKPISFFDVARVFKQGGGHIMGECAPRRRSNARVWACDSRDRTERGGNGAPPFVWTAKNISSTGAFIQTESPLPVGMVLDLVFDLDGQQAHLTAEVVRVQDPTWARRGGVGVRFLDLEAFAKKLLEVYVSQPESRASEQGPNEGEKRQLRGELTRLQAHSALLGRDMVDRLDPYEEIERLNAEKREISDRLCRIEKARAELANLYVASYQLNSALDPSEVLKAVTGILTNLVGAEVFCIYVIDEQEDSLLPIGSEGKEASAFPEVSLSSGLLAESLKSGRITTRDFGPSEGSASADAEPLVCIPMRTDERAVGVIAIYRLFEHKAELSEIDQEIFALLSGKAATAILASRLLAQSKRKLNLIKGFLDLLSD